MTSIHHCMVWPLMIRHPDAPELCADCGTESGPHGLIRERCEPCYRKRLRVLNKVGDVTPQKDLLRDRLLSAAVAGRGGCLIWTGALHDRGYGRIKVAKKFTFTHRAAYELFVGAIPAGLAIDHTCHNRDKSCPGGNGCLHRRCVNPHHLEAVPGGENTLRSPLTISASYARRTHCPQGHPYDKANTYRPVGTNARTCRTCRREADRNRAALRRAARRNGGA